MKKAVLLAVLAGAPWFSGLALAVAPSPSSSHSHEHHAAHADAGHLQLNNGQKWPTDAPLRSAMERLNKAFAARHEAIHRGKLSKGQYAELAATVEAEVAGILAECKLEPAADAQLHLVIGELVVGWDAMVGKRKGMSPRQGAETVVKALDSYGRFFDHPGWSGARHL